MPQIFHPSANTLSRLSIVAALVAAAGSVTIFYLIMRSPYQTKVGFIPPQPVPFPHEHHVRGLGLDCRYCHTSVEESSFAGLPPTHTCMTCHSQIWTRAPILEPVRSSLASKKPIAWQRVHNLPDFVYFNHSIHVQKGVGCASCHGPVQKMALMWKDQPMNMEWCLTCHQKPEAYLREKDQVFNMEYSPTEAEQLSLGKKLVEEKKVPVDRMSNCSVCHR